MGVRSVHSASQEIYSLPIQGPSSKETFNVSTLQQDQLRFHFILFRLRNTLLA
jgi:hypothetical protein